MADLIDRQAAIDALADMHCKSDEDGYVWIIRSDAWGRIDALPSAQTEVGTQMSLAQRWIPCSERLPDDVEIGEEYPTVIFCTSDGAVYVGGYEHYLGGKWWYMDTWEDEAKGVVAWMPLPEPWRGAEDEL